MSDHSFRYPDGYSRTSYPPFICSKHHLLITSEKAAQEYMMTVPGVPFQTPICYLSEHMQRLLWHFHTGHPNSDRLIKLQKMSKGIPRLKYPQAIEKCSSCIMAKMHKMARGGPENQDPTAPGQMMSMDFGFMFYKSKNSARAKKLTGINGGTSYCLIHDAYTGPTFIVTTSTKQPPIAWVMVVLTRLNC